MTENSVLEYVLEDVGSWSEEGSTMLNNTIQLLENTGKPITLKNIVKVLLDDGNYRFRLVRRCTDAEIVRFWKKKGLSFSSVLVDGLVSALLMKRINDLVKRSYGSESPEIDQEVKDLEKFLIKTSLGREAVSAALDRIKIELE